MNVFIPLLASLSIGVVQTGSKDLVNIQQLQVQEFAKIRAIREKMLAKDPNANLQTLVGSADIKDLGLMANPQQGVRTIQQALSYRFDRGTLTDFHPIDYASADPVLNYTVARVDEKGQPKFSTLKEGMAGQKLAIFRVQITQANLPVPGQAADLSSKVTTVFMGPFVKEDIVRELAYFDQHSNPGQPVRTKSQILDGQEVGTELYDNAKGEIAVVLDHVPDQPLAFPDTPEIPLYKESPAVVSQAYNSKNSATTPTQVTPLLAAKSGGQVIDFEHIRREQYLAVQALKEKVALLHPTTAQYPPELLENADFKKFGLVLPQDQATLFAALSYLPEDAVMHDYHPINFTKDKAASYSVVVTGSDGIGVARTFKEAYENKHPMLARLKVNNQEIYYGPITREALDSAKRSPKLADVQEETEQDIPLSLYTTDEGAVAFVLPSKPKQVLSLPPIPMIAVFTDPVTKIQELLAKKSTDPSNAHPVGAVYFAVPKG